MPEVKVRSASALRDLPFYPEDEKRIQTLEEKRNNAFFEIAFCGHFSAGKSTLLNNLLENQLLPTSPIPTSANIISILYGQTRLELVNSEGKRQTWEEEIPWDQVRKWGMDGEQIQSLSIFAPLPFLASKTKILDTPGVDSTDPNHQLVTSEQLYTTDMIVYVSDYNHVQSETNIRFLKQMANEGKPIILVINQIDKHDDKELSLASFENTLRVMLARYGINPLEVFFTSMKKENHPFNQFQSLTSYLKSIMYHSDSLRNESLPLLENGSVNRLIERLQDEKQEAYEQWREDVSTKGLSPDDAKDNETQIQQLNYIETEQQEKIQALYKERNQLFKDVILFPYTTTEKARFWLESRHKNFKTGFLFSKQKTREEKQSRTKALLDELNEKVKTQLIFHVKKLLSTIDRTVLDNPEEYDQRVQQIVFRAEGDWLESFAPDSEIDRNFVYTFSDQVTSAVVKEVKTKTESLFQEYEVAIQRQMQHYKEYLENKVAQSTDVQKEWQRWESIREGYDQKTEQCRQWLEERRTAPSFYDLLKTVAKKEYPTESIPTIYVTETDDSVIAAEENFHDIPVIHTEIDESFTDQLRSYLSEYGERALFADEKKQLASLLDQYDNNTVVVSLFGAFSAGKSSFINAMLGEDILPVSPHPTTSAVNRIRKSNDTYSHGTVLIQIKEEDFLNHEIQSVSREIGEELDFDSLEKWKKPSHTTMNDYQRTYADYLYTLQQSIRTKAAEPGKQIEVTLEKLRDWVAHEEKACMIREVVVHYDCDWTLQGLELVDTPGVNSIHGRHTNVAFDHLRQSDAILYVTYYNHAFSKADQVFLRQMARANEQFEMDKLFFIINASDLAGSVYELQGVKNHVKDQLVQNGVQQPRLFALSSKRGLEDKQYSTNGSKEGTAFLEFENYFSDTIINELKAGHLQKIKTRWYQIHGQLASVIASFEAGDEQLKQELKDRHSRADAFIRQLEGFDLTFLCPLLQEELQQQCTYLKDRTKLIVQDYFSQAINPAVITASTKSKQKAQLKGALQELEGLARTYIFQEQETILIRLEERLKKEFQRYVHQFMLERKPETVSIIAPQAPAQLHDTVQKEVEMVLDKEYFSSFYQSSKDFFENKKAQSLKEAFAEEVQRKAGNVVQPFEESAEKRLEEYLKQLSKWTQEYFERETDKDKTRVRWLFDTSRKEEIQEEYHYIQ